MNQNLLNMSGREFLLKFDWHLWGTMSIVSSLEDDRAYQQGLNAGIVEMFVVLVKEMDMQGSIDKELLTSRMFGMLAEHEAGSGRPVSTRDRGIADVLREVARALDRK